MATLTSKSQKPGAFNTNGAFHPAGVFRPPWILALPFAAAYVLFWTIPLFKGFWNSLRENTLLLESGWAGLANYQSVLTDPRFYHSLSNTAVFALANILVIVPLSLGLAHLLRKMPKGIRETVLFCLILPGLTAPTVLAFLFVMIFNGEHGILNTLTTIPLGLPTIDWIKDPSFIKISLVLQAVWRWTGFITFFLLAGLESLPKTYYEVAQVEGAGSWRMFRTLTLPLMRNVLFFVCLFLLLDAFILFEGAYVLLGSSGGTADAGLLFVGYVYYTAFYLGEFGTASAMSFILAPVMALCIGLFLLPAMARTRVT